MVIGSVVDAKADKEDWNAYVCFSYILLRISAYQSNGQNYGDSHLAGANIWHAGNLG